MSTRRKGPRRPRRRPRAAAARPAGNGPSPAPPGRMTVTPAEPGSAGGEDGARRGVDLLEWAAWIVLWASAAGAGFLVGETDAARALSMTVLLAVTLLPWLRWVRHGSGARLAPARVAMLHGLLAILVALVLALAGAYVWALPLLVVELTVAMIILVRAPRPAHP